MIFHTFGDPSAKPVVLIHGMLNPWQLWKDAAEHFSKEYYVVVPELDAHTEEGRPQIKLQSALSLASFILPETSNQEFLLHCRLQRPKSGEEIPLHPEMMLRLLREHSGGKYCISVIYKDLNGAPVYEDP